MRLERWKKRLATATFVLVELRRARKARRHREKIGFKDKRFITIIPKPDR